ncbi:L-tyrosine/L-tryptophan isonitrile synthase family protein [Burkholderia thailandensis]|uniref:L-tyrosine/L-tryptophan isonitrile synthase family protein n=1 Tax=Burkholderia thailandensis TaxID=57975 RepID=UPI00016A94DB|nr:isocyanide synthase family protein [Burkholderia thailandensis]AIS98917.1 pyoverdine/dityrosine biosynthesis family protein [Burkholderia thailandensis MSMB59]AIT22739.1 pyoverdine/dityrosine biosynthesis family protein [Burkholderia thailandensis E254]AOJ47324.1 paerucumarin biosynthesis protein PvcA [Burkholderia thailandensis]KVG10827.1 paerucumarin biosynthesis protein PvcA [Burkholderia thailandensis]KVG24353.1 paerucumarin biosynthesis protein PvcA [Burkholderia thailandensis]
MKCDRNNEIALAVLGEILRIHRRYPEYTTDSDIRHEVEQIHAVQLPRIRAFVDAARPIEFVLPAFPAKSPNPNKVLGRLPDMAERLSLSFLNELCERIRGFHAPGAKLTICSDGRVFGDLIRVDDRDITAYQHALRQLIAALRADHLSTYNLENFEAFARRASNFDDMRRRLVGEFADPIDAIKQKLMREEEGTLLYRAITRFMFEDGFTPDYRGSKAALQKDSKTRALGVIQRSWAWGALLATRFPDAIRLSIHPQPAASLKIGVHMMPTRDSWLTPWHGVAVDLGDQFALMKRRDVELLGGRVAMRDGRPSHYEIERSRVAGDGLLPLAAAGGARAPADAAHALIAFEEAV